MTNQDLNDQDGYLANLFANTDKFYFGDELKDLLVQHSGNSDAACRKIVERAVGKGIMQSSSPVSFGRGTFLYYANGKVVDFNQLLQLTAGRRPPIHRILIAIRTCGGIISYYEALKISGAPLAESESKTESLDELLKEIKFFNLVSIVSDKNGVKYIVANYVNAELIEGGMARHYALMMVDALFIYDILSSLKNLNLIDNEQIIYRNRKTPSLGAIHNNFIWDAFAYSKTTGINTVKSANAGVSNQQTLVVLDVVISRDYNYFDMDGFFARVQVLLNNTIKERKVLPVLVYHTIGKETLNKARALGIMTYCMSSFFGNSIFEVIKNVTALKLTESVLQPTGKNAVKLISETLKTIDSTGNEINLQNVIGDFFQSLMFQLLNHLYPGCIIDQEVKLLAMDDPENRKKYEYDFVIQSGITKEIIVIEIKGSMSNYMIKKGDYDAKSTLTWFFGRTLPSLVKHYKEGLFKNYNVKASIITAGRFDLEGQIYLNELNSSKFKPYKLDVGYDGRKLLALVDNNSLSLLKATLKKYYIKKE